MSKRNGDPGYAAGWCIYYRSPASADTCEAGVSFDTFHSTQFGERPCFLDDKGCSKPGSLPCEHIRRPTAEEIRLHDEWVGRRMWDFGIVMTGIQEWRESHKGKSVQDIIECPACGGRLHLRISSYNGHVHGCCETEGCVSWME